MVQLREESRRVLAPNQLGTYIKVSRPAVWMLMAVIFALLLAGVAWFFAGTVNESVSGTCVADETGCTVYVPLSRASEIQPGNAVTLTCDTSEQCGGVSAVGSTPLPLEEIQARCNSSNQDLAAFSQDTWGVAVTIDATVAPGSYSARIITASHRPIMLLLGLD